ncbi:MAG: LysE family translocator [Proteobacteria bacterium]|nr:LysE family translocator [Pseudomonadota bacterium]
MLDNLIPLILFCFGMTVTPGPNNIIMTATGANHGYRASLPHILGATLSIPVMCVLVGVGLGQLILLYPPAHTALNLAGSAYLLWLAWKIANFSGTVDGKAAGQPLTFMQAVVFQWLNPKCWMMYIGAVSMFTTSGGNIFWQVTVIATVFTVMVPPCFSFWSLAGVGVGRFLTSPGRRRAFNLTLALLLVASLVLAQLPQGQVG